MIIFVPIKKLSQRVPNKNFREFSKLPLYKHVLMKLVSYRVFVDTDCEELIESIKSDTDLAHVTPFLRKNHLIGHQVSVCELIHNFLKQFNIKNEIICQMHVTSPFITEETIKKALEVIKGENFDSVVSCNVYQNRLWRKESYGYCPINHNPMVLEQTQDLPVYYEENSLFYMFSSNYFLTNKNRIGVKPYFYEIKYPENLDIDTEDDWKIAKQIYLSMKKN